MDLIGFVNLGHANYWADTPPQVSACIEQGHMHVTEPIPTAAATELHRISCEQCRFYFLESGVAPLVPRVDRRGR